MATISKRTFTLLFTLFTLGKATAQECLNQTPQQKVVIANAVNVIKAQFATVSNAGWVRGSEQTGLAIPVAAKPAPFRPMMLCDFVYAVSLTADPSTPYGKIVQDSADYFLSEATKHLFGSAESMKAVNSSSYYANLQKLRVTISENIPYLMYGGPHGTNDRYNIIHLKGAAFAYQEYDAPQDENSQPDEATYIYIGNWAGIQPFKSNASYVPYPFIHKTATPNIETLVIKIAGPARSIATFINKVDWSALNNALSM